MRSVKGAGKTPASRLILGKLVDLEREEKMAYDESKKEKKKKKKGRKRSSNGEASEGTEAGDDTADFDDDVFEETDDGKEDSNGEAYMFHKKTRLADTITPEALILTLHYGSGNLLIKSDEFKVCI